MTISFLRFGRNGGVHQRQQQEQQQQQVMDKNQSNASKKKRKLMPGSSFLAFPLLVVTLSLLSLTSMSKFNGGQQQQQQRLLRAAGSDPIEEMDMNVPDNIEAAKEDLYSLKLVLGNDLDAESHNAFDAEIRSLEIHQEALLDLNACNASCEGKRKLVVQTNQDVKKKQQKTRKYRQLARRNLLKKRRMEKRSDKRKASEMVKKIAKLWAGAEAAALATVRVVKWGSASFKTAAKDASGTEAATKVDNAWANAANSTVAAIKAATAEIQADIKAADAQLA